MERPLVHCPRCGAATPPAAARCARCGLTLSPHALVADPGAQAEALGSALRRLAGRGPGVRAALRVLALAACALLLAASLWALRAR